MILIVYAIATPSGTEVKADAPAILISGTFVQDFALVIAAVVVAARVGGRPTARQFGLRTTRVWPAIGWTLLCIFLFYSFAVGWSELTHPPDTDDLPSRLGVDESTVALVAVLILVTVVAPLTEEFFFRGFLFTAVRRSIGVLPAAAITGVAFGAAHYSSNTVLILVPLGVFGALLCLLYVWTRSIIPCIVLHAVNNSLAIGVFEGWDWQIPVLMVVAVTIVLAISIPVARSVRFNVPPSLESSHQEPTL